MNAKQLTAFRAVMLAGSMSEASQMLYVSQPAVSRLIKDLEESLGFTLFERRSSRLYPTPEAHAFFVEVRRHFIGMDNLAQAADQIRMNKRGRLRIAAMPALAFSCLPQVIGEFMQDREGVSVNLAPHNTVEVTNLLGAQQAEMAWRFRICSAPGLADETARIDVLAVAMDLEMHMRPGRASRRADLGNLEALFNGVADRHQQA